MSPATQLAAVLDQYRAAAEHAVQVVFKYQRALAKGETLTGGLEHDAAAAHEELEEAQSACREWHANLRTLIDSRKLR